MHEMTKTVGVLSLTLTLLSGAAPAGAETAREMLDKAKATNDARQVKDFTQTVEMTIVYEGGGERTRQLKMYRKDYGDRRSKSMTFFLSPQEVKGVGFLAWSYPDRNDDQWLYLPEFQRTRRISVNTRKLSFQGSDFTYEDIQLFNELPDWTETDATSKLLAEIDTVEGVPCAKIELIPQDKDLAYGKLVVWLQRDAATFRQVELYDARDGNLLKRVRLGSLKTIDGVLTALDIEMTNVKKGTQTRMKLSEVAYNRGLEDDLFTERYLERGGT
jgi:outer membrane lipoprotein-sorting protein